MPLTREFRKTVLARAQKDARFRRALLEEAVDAFLSGEVEVGKTLLRDTIHATMTFAGLAEALGKSSKSLQRMLGPRGNPTAEHIFGMIKVLQDHERLRLRVKTAKTKAA